MTSRRFLIVVLLFGVVVLAAHQQHPLVPKDTHGHLDLKCSACLVHGKIIVSVSGISLGLTESPEPLSPRLRTVAIPRSVTNVPSRAPPVS